ncbi:hydroxyneurosporene-O-methyltransferase [Youhaiella tibetensis]|uniref:Hydroxyneurosporene methyltransferase n=1 Tax=Paradevosia tibetensis TaxID=1447062 RepID=A0A5B9DKW3_9HYPH|nr:methyltransferase [Youhaiella tibetensis]QEE19793.1 hydroxyneurosporene methyltransferase [Youhaiella tibetensis]GGF29947.1 hydroxyneurosporene-O-methyltransferase [Youhaiella tibetensis]
MGETAFDTIQQLAAGHYLVAALEAVTDLQVADALEEDTPVAALAERVGANPDALDRTMRLLASHGIFARNAGTIAHTDASRLLRQDHPASMRPFVMMFAQEVHWRSAAELAHSLRTGEAVATRLYDGGLWGYFEAHPDHERQFGEAMQAKARAQIEGILASHDFSPYRRIVDVGGGQGHLLRAVLEKHDQAEGVLFDVPAVVEAARKHAAPERLEYVPGSFFEKVPEGDAIVLMEILHDWPDEEASRILQTVRAAVPADARLLVIETEVPEDEDVHWSKLLDIIMLAQFASRQRTREQYRSLLEANGFLVSGVTDTGRDISVIEARPV